MESNLFQDAPPPYSAVDPLLSQRDDATLPTHGDGSTMSIHRRGGNASLTRTTASDYSIGSSSHSYDDRPTASNSSTSSTSFASAAAYFERRPPTVSPEGREVLEHHLTIYPRSQSKDFPHRPRCWSARAEEIFQHDWDAFLKFLFPLHLGLASNSQLLSMQVRAEIQRDHKDRPQETKEERQARMTAVIDEWNRDFFKPRATRIRFIYVADREDPPVSPVCPRCYPAATRVYQGSQSSRSEGAGSTMSSDQSSRSAPLENLGQFDSSDNSIQMDNVSWSADPSSTLRPPLHPPMARFGPFGAWAHGFPMSPRSMGWVAGLVCQAQTLGDRIGRQAEECGRRIERQALAHGRWIEMQAAYHGYQVGDAAQRLFSGPSQAQAPWVGQTEGTAAMHQKTPAPDPATPRTTAATPTGPGHGYATDRNIDAAHHRRRSSTSSSSSSNSSLSLFDTISTTSDLSASDLAAVRAQLLSLDDYHDRELYGAAVTLHRQLGDLREQRQRDRAERGNDGNQGPGQAHQQEDKRALKQELKALKKAFRDVFRRARDERRHQRHNSRRHRRCHGHRR